MNENEWKREDKVELLKDGTLRDTDTLTTPLGEVFFFAAGPFFKPPVFLERMQNE